MLPESADACVVLGAESVKLVNDVHYERLGAAQNTNGRRAGNSVELSGNPKWWILLDLARQGPVDLRCK